jgi:citrate synthase
MPRRYLTANQAAASLGITLPTLYAYASRGMLRSEPVPGKPRLRRYLFEDIERLKERKELRGDPEAASRRSLHWGGPVLDSAITSIEVSNVCSNVYYRGRDAAWLAENSSVEEVASLLWTGDPDQATNLFSEARPARFRRVAKLLRTLEREKRLGPIERCQMVLPWAGADDLAAYDLRPAAVAITGARILGLMASVISGLTASGSIDRALQRAWLPRRAPAAKTIRAALILCADHELNVSAFASRCVASAAATPYDAVTAGLAAMKGSKHGGLTLRVEAFFDEARSPRLASEVVANRLRRGERLPGFGHPFYPDGDPRGAMLLSMARDMGNSSQVELIWALVDAASEMTGERPTLDFGLVALARALRLPGGSSLAIFALGRTIGWIAHAIEQYQSGQLIRPRARYIGKPPETGPPTSS